MEKINVQVENGVQQLIVRHGTALEPKDRKVIAIIGNIDSVGRFLAKRSIDQKDSVVEVNRDDMTINLIIHQTSPYPGYVQGRLLVTEDFKKFKINTGKYWNLHELADFIKLNRAFFENRTEASQLVAELRNFKAKVNQDLEKADDRRGNVDYVRRQSVESNLPEAFNMKMRVFKGEPEDVFPVEVAIHPDTFECTLVSPAVAEAMQDSIDSIIDGELMEIKRLCPDLVIIEK